MNLSHPASFEKETLTFLEPFHFSGHQPSLEHIAEISRFFSRLPYENISKILKRDQAAGLKRFRLPDEVTHDHLAWHLGGTCFSLSYFLCGLYSILGYQAQPLICHLNWGQNNHSAIAIEFNGARYLVDPGYMIFRPLPLKKSNVEARLSAETGLSLRFDPESDEYAVYTFRKGQFVRRYRFADKAVSWEQFSSFWDASFDLPGMNDLTLTRVEGQEMIFVQGDFIKITSPETIKKFREGNLAETLIKERFRIPLEKLEEARYVLRQRQL
ncbi:MAG: arylamine N-acetyltransferase [Candidatus Marinimicrobia bacterium]|nr:arylamine N-acetyltransferase [Candidatus Neomarinimicrobiota bacterium]MCF7921448.1 arylamine N-acetyltransferase [Candidatus Neomarinimicrobiota bacterium]